VGKRRVEGELRVLINQNPQRAPRPAELSVTARNDAVTVQILDAELAKPGQGSLDFVASC
jgi:hypothetical protein